MPLNREQKQAIVEKVSAAARTAVSVVIADATGVPVNELTKLRREARAAQVYLHVVRNTLLARALAGSEFEQVNPHLAGSSLVALAQAHPGAGARLFVDFAKRNNNFNIKYFVFEGKFHEGSEISQLATLPTREEALAQLLATLKEAACGRLVRTLAAVGDAKGAAA